MKIVLATRNRDKAREIRRILDGVDLEVLSLDDFPPMPETVEDGDTLEENALKKALEVRAHTGMSTLSDDTGLEVDALDGEPGVFAARFAGEDATYADNCNKLLAEMEGVPENERDAVFRTVVALALSPEDVVRLTACLDARDEDFDGIVTDADDNIEALLAEGLLPGHITLEARGESGFGYDPVFFVPEAGRTLAEMSPDEKNKASHRYRALIELRETLLRMGMVEES